MNDLRDRAMRFECVTKRKVHSKDGYEITIVVQPDEIPEDLLRDYIGSRYILAMVRLNDQDEPMLPKDEGQKALSMAHILCKDEDFGRWLVDIYGDQGDANEIVVVDLLRSVLGIESRAEIKENEETRKQFLDMAKEFRNRHNSGLISKGEQDPWDILDI